MYCRQCGKELEETSMFCPNCGNKVQMEEGLKLIKLKCHECNATMEVNEGNKEVYCPSCGSKQLIVDSDAVAVEKIKSKTLKEIAEAKLEHDEKQMDKIAKENNLAGYKKSKLGKFTIVGTVFAILFTIIAFNTRHYLAVFIGLIQLGLFVISWLMGMQVLEEKRKNLHVVAAILAFVLFIPFFGANSKTVYEKLSWPKSGLATRLPDPKEKYGEVHTNNENRLYVDIDKVDDEDYEKYLEKCIDKGFVIESERDSYGYKAYDEDGYHLKLHKYTSLSSYIIEFEAPMEVKTISWPNSDLVKLLPKPASNEGLIKSETADNFIVYLAKTSIEDYNTYVEAVMNKGFNVDYNKSEKRFYAKDNNGNEVSVDYEGFNTIRIEIEKGEEPVIEEPVIEETPVIEEPVVEETPVKLTNEVDPDLKKFLDEYEVFIDEYIAFMTKYSESDNPVSLLVDYTKIMYRYEEMEKSLDNYDEDNMSAIDAAYYLEVMNRCNNKMYAALD
ncbi:MAG: zinc ribbon domain-containing protein [Erysipelotrichaceae bacterium]|nr:zinc ribbon domain-containing protein [Erysipelotrichaceae bacterium]